MRETDVSIYREGAQRIDALAHHASRARPHLYRVALRTERLRVIAAPRGALPAVVVITHSSECAAASRSARLIPAEAVTSSGRSPVARAKERLGDAREVLGDASRARRRRSCAAARRTIRVKRGNTTSCRRIRWIGGRRGQLSLSASRPERRSWSGTMSRRRRARPTKFVRATSALGPRPHSRGGRTSRAARDRAQGRRQLRRAAVADNVRRASIRRNPDRQRGILASRQREKTILAFVGMTTRVRAPSVHDAIVTTSPHLERRSKRMPSAPNEVRGGPSRSGMPPSRRTSSGGSSGSWRRTSRCQGLAPRPDPSGSSVYNRVEGPRGRVEQGSAQRRRHPAPRRRSRIERGPTTRARLPVAVGSSASVQHRLAGFFSVGVR